MVFHTLRKNWFGTVDVIICTHYEMDTGRIRSRLEVVGRPCPFPVLLQKKQPFCHDISTLFSVDVLNKWLR